MGYMTEFKGSFQFNKPLTVKLYNRLKKLAETDTRELDDGVEYPGYFCQWMPQDDGMGIAWDGNEKFGNYVEWLRWIIDNILRPNKYRLAGRVEFQGDETDDHGFLIVDKDQSVRVETVPLVLDELDELRRFKDFVLHSDYADEIKEEWLNHTRRG